MHPSPQPSPKGRGGPFSHWKKVRMREISGILVNHFWKVSKRHAYRHRPVRPAPGARSDAAFEPLGFVANLARLAQLCGREDVRNANEHEIRTMLLKFAKYVPPTPTLSQRERWSLLPLGEG